MTKNYLWLVLIIPALSVIILFSSFSGNHNRYPGGSPGGYTGSPGDGKDCTQCHGGTSSPVIGWITSDVPDNGYIPGENYNITITVSGSGDKGFEVSPQDLEGNLLGSLIPGSGNKLVGGGTAITQSSSSSANPKIWEFQWTAPVIGTGQVTFYGAFTINKPVTKTSTLTIQENTGVYIQDMTMSDMKIYPNPLFSSAVIEYELTELTIINLIIYNHLGQKIETLVNSPQTQGKHQAIWNAEGLPSGIYFYRLQAGEQRSTGKMAVIR